MYEQGEQVALQPAGALPDPCPRPGWALLPRRGVDHLDPMTGCREPDPDVGILGNVPCIPAPDVAEYISSQVIARSTERDRKSQPVQADEHQVEPVRELQREHAGQQVAAGVVEV